MYFCGLDVTTKVRMEKNQVVEKFSKNFLLREVLNFAEIWFEKTDTLVFHDPLAAAVLFEKKLCKFKKGKVFVDQIGVTGFIEDEKQNSFVAVDVNENLFFEHFFSVFADS